MTRRLVVHPQAESEIADAGRWYEREAKGLGAEFAAAVHACLEAIREQPLATRRV